MVGNKQRDSTIMDIYRELYRKSTPSADFDKLVEEAPLNKEGQKVIEFMDYEIEQDVLDSVIEKHIRKKRFSKYQKKSIKVNVYLGCSPKSKIRLGDG